MSEPLGYVATRYLCTPDGPTSDEQAAALADVESLRAALAESQREVERLERTVERLREALGKYCACAEAGSKPMNAYDCKQFPCKAGVALADDGKGSK